MRHRATAFLQATNPVSLTSSPCGKYRRWLLTCSVPHCMTVCMSYQLASWLLVHLNEFCSAQTQSNQFSHIVSASARFGKILGVQAWHNLGCEWPLLSSTRTRFRPVLPPGIRPVYLGQFRHVILQPLLGTSDMCFENACLCSPLFLAVAVPQIISGKSWWMFLEHLSKIPSTGTSIPPYFPYILTRQVGASLSLGETLKQGMYVHQIVTGGHHVTKSQLVQDS